MSALEEDAATLEVLADPEAMSDLRAAADDADGDLVDYDTLRCEAGLLSQP